MGASRVALVVGIAAYKQSKLQLANPENDAKKKKKNGVFSFL
jgi:uncharacterized caspase-like protein